MPVNTAGGRGGGSVSSGSSSSSGGRGSSGSSGGRGAGTGYFTAAVGGSSSHYRSAAISRSGSNPLHGAIKAVKARSEATIAAMPKSAGFHITKTQAMITVGALLAVLVLIGVPALVGYLLWRRKCMKSGSKKERSLVWRCLGAKETESLDDKMANANSCWTKLFKCRSAQVVLRGLTGDNRVKRLDRLSADRAQMELDNAAEYAQRTIPKPESAKDRISKMRRELSAGPIARGTTWPMEAPTRLKADTHIYGTQVLCNDGMAVMKPNAAFIQRMQTDQDIAAAHREVELVEAGMKEYRPSEDAIRRAERMSFEEVDLSGGYAEVGESSQSGRRRWADRWV